MARIHALPSGSLLPDELVRVAKRERLKSATVDAIGGVDSLTLGYFDRRSKSYRLHRFRGFMEVTSLIGNITELEGKPFLHVHGTFGRQDTSVIGGHVIRARVFPTLEVTITPAANRAVRRFDEDAGLNLIYRS